MPKKMLINDDKNISKASFQRPLLSDELAPISMDSPHTVTETLMAEVPYWEWFDIASARTHARPDMAHIDSENAYWTSSHGGRRSNSCSASLSWDVMYGCLWNTQNDPQYMDHVDAPMTCHLRSCDASACDVFLLRTSAMRSIPAVVDWMLLILSAFLPPLSDASTKKLTASCAVEVLLLVTRYQPFTRTLLGTYIVSVSLSVTYTPSRASILHPDIISPKV